MWKLGLIELIMGMRVIRSPERGWVPGSGVTLNCATPSSKYPQTHSSVHRFYPELESGPAGLGGALDFRRLFPLHT